ncbi:helix-turn-helix domain-containing protein [Desulfovibrio sp. OttesenSCG-928-C06]|nr:helix-turn-helix domain-containing protein [Desulfovibrio sp. OttesenSCG-928-C06]
MTKISKAFGPVLRQFRHAKQLTQEQLSEKVGVHAGYISRLESGQKCPNLEMLFNLADALGVSPGTMLDAVGERLRI